MNAERYQKIKEIFNQAAEIFERAERGDFLKNSCGEDSELRREIEKMLDFAETGNGGGALEKNAFEIFADCSHAKLPERIGAYKIRREIGRGGMGAVYEAVRGGDDNGEDFRQKAALKVIKRGMDSDAIVRRFRRERKILASLEHPNIARFLDGGITDDGLPFYAMEFVEGEFIDDYCRRKNLSVEEKLKLFREVCAAVLYAHQNLVVHRDLKPKNILVTKDGAPKLLDFGIGKILSPDADSTEEEIGTATQLGMMTPAYASPEQIRGERIGTTSDVYSLGVILYELLTGQKPYRLSSNSQIEIQRAVLESEPLRPSSIVSSKFQVPGSKFINESAVSNKESKTNPKSQIPNPKSLRGDLDNIILKALRKEPAARYVSVGQFSEDIRRYLEGKPVIARPHTFSYRAAKFMKRNRVGVAAFALVFLSLCVGITAAVWQARRADEQRALAENRFNLVRQLANSVVFKYHDAIADLEGSTAAREMLVRDALQYLDALADGEAENDDALKTELALAYLKLGDAQGKIYAANIGDTAGALVSYQKAVALLEKVVTSSPADAKAKSDLIKAYDSLAFLTTRSGGGNARELVEKALRLHEELEKNAPGDDARRMQYVELLIRYGDTASGFENNLREHLKALPVIEELAARDAENVEKLRQLARANQRVGTDLQRLGDQAEKENRATEAADFYRRSLEYQRRMFAAAERLYALDAEKPANRRYLALARINLSHALANNGLPDEALRSLVKAREIVEENLRRDPKNNESKFDLSVVYETFAKIHQIRGDKAADFESRQKSLALDKEIYRADSQNVEVLNRIVKGYESFARAAESSGDRAQAEIYRRRHEEFANRRTIALAKK